MHKDSQHVASCDRSQRNALLRVVAITSLSLEVVRYLLHSSDYSFFSWLAVGGSVIANQAYHSWSLPASPAKSVVSAVFGEATMPGLLVSSFEMVWGIAPVLVRFLKANVPGPVRPA